MEFIVPLCIQPVPAFRTRAAPTHVVEIAFRYDPSLAPKRSRQVLKAIPQFGKNMMRAEIEDAVDGVQAERIDVIFRKPVQRVVDEETPDSIASRPIIVDGVSPRRPVA